MQGAVQHEKLAELITRATNDVFGTMLGLDVTVVENKLCSEGKDSGGGVMSLIGFAGPWVGTGSFSCTPAMSCRIANALLGSEHLAVEEDVLDAIAEMTNMILGNVKTELEEIIGPMLLSVPTVIFGRNFTTRSTMRNNWTVVIFQQGDEKIAVKVCLTSNVDQQEARPGFKMGYSLHV